MKMLLVFLLFCSAASGQPLLFAKDSAAVKLIGDLPVSEPFDSASPHRKANTPFVYIMSDNDIYSSFGYKLSVKYREFDFSKYHILGMPECEGCHKWIWVMRENQKTFTEVSSTTFPGHIGATIPEGRKSFFEDTVIHSVKDILARWYTHGAGDCHARFEFTVTYDKYYPVLLLKEKNFWGGCRAGGFWDFTVSFKSSPGIQYYRKNIILMAKEHQ